MTRKRRTQNMLARARLLLTAATTVATVVLFLLQRRRRRLCWERLVRLQLALSPRGTASSVGLTRGGCVVHVISTEAEAEAALGRWLSCGALAPIGLDVEWVRGRPPALLQLSRGDEVLLLRLCLMRAAPPSLELLLHDEAVLKVGVGVAQDLRRLEGWLRSAPPHAGAASAGVSEPRPSRGGLELAPLAFSVAGCTSLSLAHIAGHVLGVAVRKEAAVRCSDWEAPDLSPAQRDYAAADASLPLAVLRELHRRCATRGLLF